MLSHGNLRRNIDQSLSSGDRQRPGRRRVRRAAAVPHLRPQRRCSACTLRVGAAAVLVQRFDPATALDTIRDRRRHHRARRAADVAGVGGDGRRSTRPRSPACACASTGAAKMPEAATRHLRERFGVRLREGYGLTEASPVVTTSTGIDAARRARSACRCPASRCGWSTPTATTCSPATPARSGCAGPNVFAGYWEEPEATARVLTPDGWLRTGDIAVTDDDGYLYLVDRAKDLIIVSGFNVFPAEVEDVIAELPGVAEVAVVGVPHPHSGRGGEGLRRARARRRGRRGAA